MGVRARLPSGEWGPCWGEITPQAENCSTPEDEDCDGKDCPCAPGKTRSCYTGPPETLAKGVCRGGTQTCSRSGQWPFASECDGEVTPKEEDCTTPVSESCGNSECACAPGATRSCYTGPPGTKGVGICKAGQETCSEKGEWSGSCDDQVLPEPFNCAVLEDKACNERANCACVPEELIVHCYSGPEGTEGKGLCHGGPGQCKGDGTGWICEGEVTPSVEKCDTPEDESCDGKSGCNGNLVWSKAFGSEGYVEVLGVAADPVGNVVIVGEFAGSLDFGGPSGHLMSASSDVFVVKLDASGDNVWARAFGDADGELASSVAVDGTGDVFVSGNFQHTITFEQQLDADGSWRHFVAKLDGDTGAPLWSKKGLGTIPDVSLLGVNGNNHLVFVGTDNVGVDSGFDGCPVVGAFVAELAGDTGACHFAKPLGMTFNLSFAVANVPGVANQDLLFAGLSSPSSSFCNDCDNIVASLDENGENPWSTPIALQGVGSSFMLPGIGALPDGGAMVFGTVGSAQPLTVQVGACTALPAGQAQSDLLLARVSTKGDGCGPGLQGTWAKRFYVNGASAQGHGFAVDSAGNAVISGSVNGSIDFGGGPLAGDPQKSQLFLAKLDSSGSHVWSRLFAEGAISHLAVDPSGDIFMVGTFSTPFDLGGELLQNPKGPQDNTVFIAKFGP